RMQRDRERIGEHGFVVAHLVGDRDAHRLVRGHERREPARRGAAVAGVDAGRDDAASEVAADGVLAVLAFGTWRGDASWPARQPGVQHDPLADTPDTDARADTLDGA